MEEKESVGEEISNLSSQEGAEKRPVSEETVHIAESVAALEEEEPEHLEDRVKMLSPGAVVAKRFFRSKLSVIGLITLIVLFVFSFAGPLLQFVTPAIWGQDEVDRSPGLTNMTTSTGTIRSLTSISLRRTPSISTAPSALRIFSERIKTDTMCCRALCTAAEYRLRWDSSLSYSKR